MDDPATSMTSSLWASLNSWFTSTVFFVLLNLMIATILFTSNLPQQQQPPPQEQQQDEDNQKKNPQILRSPSILHRLKSFNFSPQRTHNESGSETHYQQHPLEVAATQYVFNQPLEYQHFDFSSTDSDQINEPRAHDTQSRADHVSTGYDFHQFDFDPSQQDTRRNVAFDFDPTRKETRGDAGFDVDPIRKETRRKVAFDFEPTRKHKGFDFEPTKETVQDTGFGFEPVRPGFENSDEENELESLDEVYSRLKSGGGHDRTKSDGSITTKPAAKMKKSASLKVGSTHLEEEEVEIVEARRPATVKERKSAAAVKVVDEDDVEVDSRADDFINKFKNDLKLQRIESIMRTKGLGTNRGGGK